MFHKHVACTNLKSKEKERESQYEDVLVRFLLWAVGT